MSAGSAAAYTGLVVGTPVPGDTPYPVAAPIGDIFLGESRQAPPWDVKMRDYRTPPHRISCRFPYGRPRSHQPQARTGRLRPRRPAAGRHPVQLCRRSEFHAVAGARPDGARGFLRAQAPTHYLAGGTAHAAVARLGAALSLYAGAAGLREPAGRALRAAAARAASGPRVFLLDVAGLGGATPSSTTSARASTRPRPWPFSTARTFFTWCARKCSVC